MANDQIAVSLKPPSGLLGWQMKVENGNWTAGPNFPGIPVPNKHQADITFTIYNDPGQNAIFAPTPILVAVKDKVFDNPTPNSPTSFTITDKNPDPGGQFPYALMFKNAPKIDPIIDNGGGGITRWPTAYYAEIGGLMLLSLVVGMIVQRAFRLLR